MSRKITPLYFFNLKCHIFWTKTSHQNKTFGPLSGWVKMHKISHVIFETFLMSSVSFYLNFASLVSVMRDNSFVLFYLNLILF